MFEVFGTSWKELRNFVKVKLALANCRKTEFYCTEVLQFWRSDLLSSGAREMLPYLAL